MTDTENHAKFRNFCFTIFTITQPKQELVDWILSQNARYTVVGDEICPTTGRRHYQGFVCFKNPRTFNAIRNLFKRYKPHLEACKGSVDDNVDYCKKGGDFVEAGDRPEQGRRYDLEGLRDRIMEGELSLDELILMDPMVYHRYGRTLQRIEDLHHRTLYRTEMTKGTWIWGPSGVGKSHVALANYDPLRDYIYPNDNGWWDGYVGQERVIFNDFRGEIPMNMLLQLTDKWPTTVRRRNREPIPFTSREIIITSSMSPRLCYLNAIQRGDGLAQLLRRFDVIHMNVPTGTEELRGNTGTLSSNTDRDTTTSILTEMLRRDDNTAPEPLWTNPEAARLRASRAETSGASRPD